MLSKEMPPSSEVSMRSRSALTVLSHDDLGRLRRRLQKTPGTSATRRLYGCRNLQASRQRDPGERRLLWMTVDSGCAPLLLWISMLVMKSDHRTLQICRRKFPAKGINFPFFTLRHCPCLRSVNKHWNQVWVVQSEFCPKGYTGLPDISLQAAEHATSRLHSSLDLQTVAAGLAG